MTTTYHLPNASGSQNNSIGASSQRMKKPMSPQPTYKLPGAGTTNYTFTKKVSLDLGGGGGGGSASQLH